MKWTHKTMDIQDMESLWKSTFNPGSPPCQWQIMTKKPHAYSMHAKTSDKNIHATRYLQTKYDVVVDLDVLFFFPYFPFPSCSKNPSMPHSPRVLQETVSVQEYERERERENESFKTELTKRLPTNWSENWWITQNAFAQAPPTQLNK